MRIGFDLDHSGVRQDREQNPRSTETKSLVEVKIASASTSPIVSEQVTEWRKRGEKIAPEKVAEWRKQAEQGDAKAQYDLGMMSYISTEYQQAAAWFRKAAEQGYMPAQYFMGAMSVKGQGVTQDYQQAATWYRKAAEQGNVYAQYDLGLLYKKSKAYPKIISKRQGGLAKLPNREMQKRNTV